MSNLRTRSVIKEQNNSVTSSLGWYINESGQLISQNTVGYNNARQITAVYGSIRILSGVICSIPLKLYQKKGRNRFEADSHELYKLFTHNTSKTITSTTFMQVLGNDLIYTGNFFAFKAMVRGKIESLHRLHPRQTTIEIKPNGERVYKYNNGSETIEFAQEEIWHIAFLPVDGVLGIDPITNMELVLNNQMALQKHTEAFYRNSARPSVVLETDMRLNDEARSNLSESWQAAYSGNNAYKVALLEHGIKARPLSVSNEQAQYLGTRQYSKRDIAQCIFGVPAHLVGEESSAFTSNLEQFYKQFLTFTLEPLFTIIKSSMNLHLLNNKERDSYFFDFVTEAFVKMDSEARNKILALQLQNGVTSPNEWRSFENRNPIEGGDKYYTPLNMAEIGGDADDIAPIAEPTPVGGNLPSRAEILKPALMQELERALKREQNNLKEKSKRKDIDSFYDKHRLYLNTVLKPYCDIIEKKSVIDAWIQSSKDSIDYINYWNTRLEDFCNELLRGNNASV